MAWSWRCENESGEAVTPAGGGETFPTQSDAESWVGEVWPDLVAQGVASVTLLDGDREVYGPMSLSNAD